jgi:radical SAM superfamily enzyme YgiQ (UPF0313 family)
MPPLGLMSIGATLKHYCKDIVIEIINAEFIQEDELFEAIKKSNPDVLGITTNVGCYRSGLEIAKKVKEANKDIKVVLGGPYVSIMWKECLSNRNYIDCCVIGDGEFPMVQICNNVPLNNIKGVASRDPSGSPVLNEPEDIDLDQYPDPDWTLIDPSAYQIGYKKVYGITNAVYASISSQSGCKWRIKTGGGCIFCGLVRPNFRARSPERVWNEIHNLYNMYECNHFWELSDTICASKEWLKEFYKLRPKQNNFFFRGYARASEITKEMANYLKQLGYKEIFIGIESGDNNILKHTNKGSTDKVNLRATKILSDAGIKTFASVVLGLPEESTESLETTFNHVIKLFDNGLYTLSVCVFAPYPGSRAFNMIRSHPAVISKYLNQDTFDWPLFSKDWIDHFCNCNLKDIENISNKFNALPNSLYEDNFSYVDKIYNI